MPLLQQAFPFPGTPGMAWPYSEAVRAGDYLFISGQGPLNMVTGQVIPGDIEAETDLTLANIRQMLGAAGAAMHQVVKACVHLADMDDFEAMGRTFSRHFAEPRPARITVQSRLWGGIKVEIDAIAYAPEPTRLIEPAGARQGLRSQLPTDPAQARIVALLQDLHPAVVCDILDGHGRRQQAMGADIRPLWPEAQLAGVVQTVHCQPSDRLPPRGEEYRLLFSALDSLTPGQVLMTDRVDSCLWGELMSEAALRRGCRGVVCEGYARDTRGIVGLGFPTFVKGMDCRDVLGRAEAVAVGVPITCGGVLVRPGDFVIGDIDGVVVVPQDIAAQVVEEAAEKAQGESMVRTKLREGMPVSEAWRRYGIM